MSASETARGKVAQRIDLQMRGKDDAQLHNFVLVHATLIDANAVRENSWVRVVNGKIENTGSGDFPASTYVSEAHARRTSISEADTDEEVIDVHGFIVCPGFIDIHSHGAWGASFDDGSSAIAQARAFHMIHGTTRQVLSLITNPWDLLLDNVRKAAQVSHAREDVLGLHLEGPFLAIQRKGAHDERCLLDPTDDRVRELLHAADDTLRQITIAPELPHGVDAISQFTAAGVHAAVGHCDANYEAAVRGFEGGADILTHMFDAMNGISHRAPGPIAAAIEREAVVCEIIADGFHVQVPVLRLAARLACHRLALVTDSMAAAGCPDGAYTLGNLDVKVVDGHARLASNGAIAGSTLVLEQAVQRMVHEVGMSVQDAIEAATFTPARAIGVHKVNSVTSAPLGLLQEGYAADLLVLHPDTLEVQRVWCAGHEVTV
ncbi:N-acetylglucosamine-6-phosphate deacetylase [Alloscardovia venturai]|uniref:N-acetylglucosamine-6-phosphate deacetylase n=1 Tax=Alloscardovia venturai TaxID=1769421 RepID=A0ABW2Y405_9BIFI